MISHHDTSELFEQYADRMYRFTPQSDQSVQAEVVPLGVDTNATSVPDK